MMAATVNSNAGAILSPRASPVTAAVPAVEEFVCHQSSPDDSDGNASTKPAWNRPYEALESGVVMGAVSWPTLSESTNVSLKPPLADDDPISVPQVTAANESSSLASPQKQATSKLSKPNPNATQHYGRPARQKSMKPEGGGSSSSDGVFSQSSSTMGDTLHSTTNSPSKMSSGGDRPHNYRKSNSGPHLRRDHDRRNHDWNHQRSFNGRDLPQRAGPSGFIRPPPPGATTYFPPPPVPYGSFMGIPPEVQPLYYFAPHPGMPLVAQMPPAVYYSPLDPQLHAKIINQIDYYFSIDNLIKDTYLRKNMDEYGWVPVQLIANFKKVMELTTDIQLILDAVRASTVVEVQGDKIRKRGEWMRWIMPSSSQFPAASGSQYPRMLQDILPAHVQGLTLEENKTKFQL